MTDITMTDYELSFLNFITNSCISQFKSGTKDQQKKLKANIEAAFTEGLTDFRNGIKREDKIKEEFKKARNDYFMTCPKTTDEEGLKKLNDILNNGLQSKIKTISNKRDLSAADILAYSNKFSVSNVKNIPTKSEKNLLKFTLPNTPIMFNSTKIYASECLFTGLASLDKKSGIGISRSIPTCAKQACAKLNEIGYKIRKFDHFKTKLALTNFRFKLQIKKKQDDAWTDLTDTLAEKYSQELEDLSKIVYIPYSPKTTK